MKVTQLSVFLENKPGHLQSALAILAQKGINITTLTIAETADFGILRMLADQPEQAQAVLKEGDFTASITEVLAIEITDSPGSLHQAIATFSRNNLNIEYMYAFTGKRGNQAVMIFRFDDIDKAADALQKEGYKIINHKDLLGR